MSALKCPLLGGELRNLRTTSRKRYQDRSHGYCVGNLVFYILYFYLYFRTDTDIAFGQFHAYVVFVVQFDLFSTIASRVLPMNFL